MIASPILKKPKVHILKCFLDRYKYISLGKCTADLRPNDRDFKEGDYIVYKEGAYENGTFVFTGKEVVRKITYVDSFGLPDNLINLSITQDI